MVNARNSFITCIYNLFFKLEKYNKRQMLDEAIALCLGKCKICYNANDNLTK